MTLRDVEVIELLADEPELLAIADAVSASQQKGAKPRRRRIEWWVSDVPALVPPWLSRPPARPRLLVGLSAAVAAVVAAGVVVGLVVTATSPPSAYAAAKTAMAATAAAASGTVTLSSGTSSSIAAGGVSTVLTVRWNGKDVAIAWTEGSVLPSFDRILLVGGGVYLQRANDGSWLHYASEADLGPSLGSGTVLAAYGLAVASRAAQIIASAYGLEKTEQPDGSTVYSGTIPPNSPVKGAPSKDLGGLVMDSAQSMLPTFGSGGAFQLVVGSDGLVRQMSDTAVPPATGAWRVEYSRLGDTPPITPPPAYSEGTAVDLPTPPQEPKAPTKTAPHPAATVPAGTGR